MNSLKRGIVAASALLIVTPACAFTTPSDSQGSKSPAAQMACTQLKPVRTESLSLSHGLKASVRYFRSANGQAVFTSDIPSGWSPLTATASELRSFGFAPRPTTAAGLAQWKQLYKNFKGTDPRFATAPLCESPVKHGLDGYKSSYNYAGIDDITNSYNGGYATLELPSPSSTSCSGYNTSASFWIGSTDNSTAIDQTGIDFDPRNHSHFLFWGELWPLDSVYYGGSSPTDMPWSTGDHVKLTEEYSSLGGGTFYFSAYDSTTGYTYSPGNFTGDSKYYKSANFDFVTEQLAGDAERDFGSAYWSAARVLYTDGTDHYPGTPGCDIFTTSFATQYAPSDGEFTQEWNACF